MFAILWIMFTPRVSPTGRVGYSADPEPQWIYRDWETQQRALRYEWQSSGAAFTIREANEALRQFGEALKALTPVVRACVEASSPLLGLPEDERIFLNYLFERRGRFVWTRFKVRVISWWRGCDRLSVLEEIKAKIVNERRS